MTALPQPLPEPRWSQSCWNADCHRKGQVQATTPTGTALRCGSCQTPMNVVRIPATLPARPVAEAKPCRFCRERRAASDLGCCESCYERRHPDFENESWLDEADQRWAEQQYRRDVS